MRYDQISGEKAQAAWPDSLPGMEFEVVGVSIKSMTFSDPDGRVLVRLGVEYDGIKLCIPVVEKLWRVSVDGLTRDGFTDESRADSAADDFAREYMVDREKVTVEEYEE